MLTLGCLASNIDDTPDAGSAAARGASGLATPPNVIFILTDDLGYGDLSCYDSLTAKTPRIDELAAQGVRFTQAYTGNAICTPARAALLTGRYGPRVNLPGRLGGIYNPRSTGGLPSDEVTIAEVLSDAGYATALVGKWHLGHLPQFLPMRQGFEQFYGLPYSNDMTPTPLMDGEQTLDFLEQPNGLSARPSPTSLQATLSARYTQRALRFIRQAHAADRPFFLYYATHLPHTPLAASYGFVGRSPSCKRLGVKQACGMYVDVISELDFSVGRILDELELLGIRDNTLVVFTSDNGPWLYRHQDGGSAGPLREGKSTVFEGGFRIPMIVSFPAQYRMGEVDNTPVVMTDWFPTIAQEAGAALPDDRVLDGKSLSGLLRGTGTRLGDDSLDDLDDFELVYYRIDAETPGAFRMGRFKYMAETRGEDAKPLGYETGELLFDLEADPQESTDLSQDKPELLRRLKRAMMRSHRDRVSNQSNRGTTDAVDSPES